MLTCSRHRQPRPVFAPLRLFPLHWRVRCARPGSSLAAFLCGRRRGTAPAGGGSQFPSGPGALRLAFRLVWRPGGGGFPFFPSCAFDQRRSHCAQHVASRGLPDCAAPACKPSVSFANPSSRRSEPATPPLWCMARWSVPACLAAVGIRSRVEASAQLSLLLCLEGGNSREP